jgi:predicted Zn finger-like uncharacterized protein
MIIECINCNKKFNVNADLIPENGRLIQCGSCDHKWHYEIKKTFSDRLNIDEKNDQQEKILKNIVIDDLKIAPNDEAIKTNKQESYIEKSQVAKKDNIQKANKPPNIGNFFSYLIVFVISLVALIIFLDTIKSPLIDIFPEFEIILFNLFETLKDIKSFIIDLT